MNFDIEVSTETNEYTVEFECNIEREDDYGADADGNRGVTAYSIFDLEVYKVYSSKGDEIKPDNNEMELVIRECEKYVEDDISNFFNQGE